MSKMYVSGTHEDPGWTFYKCKYHSVSVHLLLSLDSLFAASEIQISVTLSICHCQVTCNFWHWELEYVLYLCDQNVLRGDAAVEAHLWAEERREELEQALGKK
jgi:hypothetical protein